MARRGRSGIRHWPRPDRDAGSLLIEVLVAMSLLAIIAAAGANALLAGMATSAVLQHKQIAATVANRAMESVRAVNPQYDADGCSKLLQGRTQSVVTAQWAAAPALGISLSGADPVWASSGCPVSPVILPLQGVPTGTGLAPEDPVTLNAVDYTVRTYIGSCVVVAGIGCQATHLAAPGSLSTAFLVTVAVSWVDRSCRTGCRLISSTIIDPKVDQLFNVRAAGAPVAVADAACVVTGTPTAVNVTGNDTGSLGKNPVTIVDQPKHGTLKSSISSGTGGYTSATGYVGNDAFKYYLSDVNGTLSSTVTVSLTVGTTC